MKSLDQYSKFFLKDQLIFSQGEIGKEMYIVKKGRVRIELNVNNEKKVIGYIEEGDFFGEMAIIDNNPRTAYAVADEDTELIFCNKNRFYRLIETSPEFAIKVVKRLSSRLREANDRFKNVSSTSKVGLFATVLSYLSSKHRDEFKLEDLYSFLHKDGVVYSDSEIADIIKFLSSNMIIDIKNNIVKVTIDFRVIEIIKNIVNFLSF